MGESILLIHACAYQTVIYGVVIVSRNLERANENDGFKMTALETRMITTLLSNKDTLECKMFGQWKHLSAK